MKVLIVDDVLENRMLMRNIVSDFGQCDMATNGVEAVEWVETALAEQEPYDLILLDIMMPKMDGQAALRAIRTKEREYSVVGVKESVILMVTADSSSDSVTQAFFRGYCTDFLVKPVTRQILLDKLREYNLIAD
jgi:two-component system chemotaxis response regulator CheY